MPPIRSICSRRASPEAEHVACAGVDDGIEPMLRRGWPRRSRRPVLLERGWLSRLPFSMCREVPFSAATKVRRDALQWRLRALVHRARKASASSGITPFPDSPVSIQGAPSGHRGRVAAGDCLVYPRQAIAPAPSRSEAETRGVGRLGQVEHHDRASNTRLAQGDPILRVGHAE